MKKLSLTLVAAALMTIGFAGCEYNKITTTVTDVGNPTNINTDNVGAAEAQIYLSCDGVSAAGGELLVSATADLGKVDFMFTITGGESVQPEVTRSANMVTISETRLTYGKNDTSKSRDLAVSLTSMGEVIAHKTCVQPSM